MNRNDIIKLAGEAGFSNNDGIVMGGASDLERFAALIEQHCNTHRPPPHRVLLEKVRQEEREQCAKVCEQINADAAIPFVAVHNCAAAIRARN